MRRISSWSVWCFFFFTRSATTEFYTLSLHDALPILLIAISTRPPPAWIMPSGPVRTPAPACAVRYPAQAARSEEHTSELQSHHDLVCRLLLEKKNVESAVIRIINSTLLYSLTALGLN